jgi:putative membrane protein
MKIVNFIGAGALLVGMSIFSFTPAQAALESPDSDALIAGYQIIQFDLQECNALQRGVSMSNGSGTVPTDITDVASKMCGDAAKYRPLLLKAAKDKDFDLPTSLPYSLTAQYAALIRNPGPGLGVAFLNDQIASHEAALAVFQDEAANGKDPEIRATAAKVIPTVESNLALLKKTLASHS